MILDYLKLYNCVKMNCFILEYYITERPKKSIELLKEYVYINVQWTEFPNVYVFKNRRWVDLSFKSIKKFINYQSCFYMRNLLDSEQDFSKIDKNTLVFHL